jgi:CheY-like chemotaxis protein
MSEACARLQGLRILVLEDELVIALELEDLLGRLGCQVIETVPTIERALRAAERGHADVAVLDVNLHGERVTPVAEALREKGVPFVLVTGYGRERLPKPFCSRFRAFASPSVASGLRARSARSWRAGTAETPHLA